MVTIEVGLTVLPELILTMTTPDLWSPQYIYNVSKYFTDGIMKILNIRASWLSDLSEAFATLDFREL